MASVKDEMRDASRCIEAMRADIAADRLEAAKLSPVEIATLAESVARLALEHARAIGCILKDLAEVKPDVLAGALAKAAEAGKGTDV